jgi:hypothetical protein
MPPEVVVTVTVISVDCPAAPEIVKAQMPATSGVKVNGPAPLAGEKLASGVTWQAGALKAASRMTVNVPA